MLLQKRGSIVCLTKILVFFLSKFLHCLQFGPSWTGQLVDGWFFGSFGNGHKFPLDYFANTVLLTKSRCVTANPPAKYWNQSSLLKISFQFLSNLVHASCCALLNFHFKLSCFWPYVMCSLLSAQCAGMLLWLLIVKALGAAGHI